MSSSQQSPSPQSVVNFSSPQSHTRRAPLRAEEVCVGCVVWLPDKYETSHVGIMGRSDVVLNREGYYHPAIIVAIRRPPTPRHTGDLQICFALVNCDFSIIIATGSHI